MNIQALETFIKTAELLHFGRASQVCNLSPSALTRTIQRLEEEVGAPLFIRDNRSVSLTSAGSRLLTYARRSVQEWERFRDSMMAPEAIEGTLSIYASITAVYSLLPSLLEAFRVAYPDVHLELNTGAAEKAIDQLTRSEIDLAVAALPDRQQSKIQFMPLVTTPLVFIAPAHFNVSDSLDLSATPLVLPRSGMARHRVEQWCKKHQQRPNINSEVSGNEAIIAMVRLGCGVGVVPRLVLDRSPFKDEILILSNAPILDPYQVGLCSSVRSLQRPAVRALWGLAESLELQ